MKMYQVPYDERDTLETLIESHINMLNTAILVQVNSASDGANTINVNVLSKRSYLDENNVRQYKQFQPIDIHLAYQKGFKSDIKAGDYGIAIVMQSDILPYTDGKVDSPRKFDLLDAIFIPFEFGGANVSDIKISSDANIIMTAVQDVNITLQKLSIQNATYNLMTIMQQWLTNCVNIVVDPSEGYSLTAGVKAQFQTLLMQLETFIA